MSPKILDKKTISSLRTYFFCVKMTRYSQRFLNCIKSQYSQIVYTLKALLCKIWFYFFFSSSDMHKFHYLFGFHATGINYSWNTFLNALSFLNLLYQANSSS